MQFSPAQIRAATWLGMGLLAWLLLAALSPVLMPFVLAAVLAYALHPWVERMAARRVPRWLGAGLAITVLMLVMLAVAFACLPVFILRSEIGRRGDAAALEALTVRLRSLGFGLAATIDNPETRHRAGAGRQRASWRQPVAAE